MEPATKQHPSTASAQSPADIQSLLDGRIKHE
jgi:hypothetical protein